MSPPPLASCLQVGHRGRRRRRGLRFADRGWRGSPRSRHRQPGPAVRQAGFGVLRHRGLPPPAKHHLRRSRSPRRSPDPPRPSLPTLARGGRRGTRGTRGTRDAHPPPARLTPAALPPLPGCFSAAGNGPFPEGFCARDCRGRWAGQGAGHPRRCVLPAARLPGAGGALALPRACRGSRDLSFFLLPRHPSPEEKRVGKK